MSQPFDDGPKPMASRPDVKPAATRPSPAGGFSPQKTNFYSPPPSVSEPSASESSATWGPGSARLIGVGVAVAAAIVLVVWIGVAMRKVPSPPAAVSAPAVNAPAEKVKSMAVSAADRDDKATEQLKAILGVTNAAVAAAKRDDLKAENAPVLTRLATAAPHMASDLQSGRRRLYRVYLLDFLEQDGDRVELFVDGVSFGDIDLKNEGASVLLPVATGTPLQIKMLATADGGGGVTVAFISSLGEARTSVMQVGGFEQWQVIVQ